MKKLFVFVFIAVMSFTINASEITCKRDGDRVVCVVPAAGASEEMQVHFFGMEDTSFWQETLQRRDLTITELQSQLDSLQSQHLQLAAKYFDTKSLNEALRRAIATKDAAYKTLKTKYDKLLAATNATFKKSMSSVERAMKSVNDKFNL